VAELEKQSGSGSGSGFGAAGGQAATFKNFLATLAENNRLGLLEGVCDKFEQLMSAHRGEMDLVITSATRLEDRVVKRLESAVAKSEYSQGKKVKVVTRVGSFIPPSPFYSSLSFLLFPFLFTLSLYLSACRSSCLSACHYNYDHTSLHAHTHTHTPTPTPRWIVLNRQDLADLSYYQVNPEILGGLVVELGDRTIDYSVSAKVAKINKLLTDSV
jgi:F0F1-type ATP synthase delta subunit